VTFDLRDSGQADVMVVVSISDGTKLVFPDGSGASSHGSTTLPPGRYAFTVLVYANAHGAFGVTYDSSVSIGGVQVATTAGALAAGASDTGSTSFVLQV